MSGEIPACPYMGCEFKCCNFDQGNYIVMYPGEHEDAVERGESVAHLRVIDDDDNGGKRAVFVRRLRRWLQAARLRQLPAVPRP